MKLAIILSVTLLFSCSVLKHKTSEQTKTETDTEKTAHEKTDTETNTKTTIEEKANGSVKLPESTLTGEGTLDSIPLTLEDDNQKVVITPNGKGKVKIKATIKPKEIPVLIDKKTVIEEKKVVKQDSSGTENKREKTAIKTTEKDVKKFGLPWWSYLLLLLIAVGYILYRGYIKRK